jgi:aspartate/methionine/tyrosine aminotransferase
MTEIAKLSSADRGALKNTLDDRYNAFAAKKLSLDMTRGKPSSEQLDLGAGMINALAPSDYKAADGTDTRNYGGVEGLAELRAIFGEILGAPAANVVLGGNSSLQMMHDTVVRALVHGVPGGNGPWGRGKVKFVCPSPGYDRHFAVCAHHGIEMIVVGMDDGGPDVAEVERIVAADESVKGMWCVPKYSNPTGITYGADVVKRLASMKAAAPDFRLFWDNAYVVHDLYATSDDLANVLEASAKAGNADRPLVFASTSKISFAGAGVAAIASSPANVADVKRHTAIQTIGPDKLNQLRHVRFFNDLSGIKAHMQKHAALLAPKFAAVDEIFTRELGGKGVATWTKPRGGYFTSIDTLDGCAKKVVRLAVAVGVKLTAAGATFPYGKDPRDRNIRIAPSLPPLDQIRVAMEVVAVCVLLASLSKLS